MFGGRNTIIIIKKNPRQFSQKNKPINSANAIVYKYLKSTCESKENLVNYRLDYFDFNISLANQSHIKYILYYFK